MELPEPKAAPAIPIPPVTNAQAPLKGKSNPQLAKVAQNLLGPLNSYTIYGVTQGIYQQCGKFADYTIPEASQKDAVIRQTAAGEDLGQPVGESWWLDPKGAGLQPTFSSWSQVTMLHMWLFVVRFRAIGAEMSKHSNRTSKELANDHQQHLVDHFFSDAEGKMAEQHNMEAAGTRNKYLKDLHLQWRGCLAAYDEALIKGDTVLATAVWRNVFKADENVDVEALAMIVSYLRKALKELGSVNDGMLKGIKFRIPAAEAGVVRTRSAALDEPLKSVKKDSSMLKPSM